MRGLVSALLALLLTSGDAFRTPITRHTRKFARPSSSRMAMLADSSVLTSIAASAELLPRVAELAVGPIVLVSSGVAIVNGMEELGVEEAEKDPNAEVDIYRDTLLRYMGYANEVGEAFAPLVPLVWFVPSTYAVAISYVLADTIDKGYKAYTGGKYGKSLSACAAIETFDAGIWQLTASVALPGFTIHQIVALTVLLEESFLGIDFDAAASSDFVDTALHSLPTAIGLLTIPFVVKPLDELAEKLMDWTLRRTWSDFLDSCSVEFLYDD